MPVGMGVAPCGMTPFTDEEFTAEQVTLCLAGLCYRGFAGAAGGALQGAFLRQGVEDGLRSLAPLEDKWELVWGPAAYRARFSPFDDGLMYVVRRDGERPCYVVAVRGTNPISGFDWLFGDFWTAVQSPWDDGRDGATISLSTALGLRLLQRLRAVPRAGLEPSPTFVSTLLSLGQRIVRPVTRLGASLLEDLEVLRVPLDAALGVLRRQAASLEPPGSDARLRALAAMLGDPAVRQVIALARRLIGNHLDQALFELVSDDPGRPVGAGDGVELLAFLAAAVAHDDRPVDVVVTGHSKGGALAPTLALWLAETQGPGAATHERWDERNRASVHSWSFAGPTAGNAGFAKRSNRALEGRCHRIANPLDVVPHAWASSDLGKIPALYDPTVARSEALGALVTLAGGLTNLGYTQIEKLREDFAPLPGFTGKSDETRSGFFDQFAQQHMEAYLQAFDLTRHGITTPTFFR
jgi:hypothetical protein